MRRGDVLIIATDAGFGGKPRPALVVQDDVLGSGLSTVVVALFTTSLDEVPVIRPRFAPTEANGLREISDLMVDVLVTGRRGDVGKIIGHLSDEEMARADRALLVFLGFAA